MARPSSTQPTDGELRILQVLWEAGPAELGKVCSALRRSRPVATTTVATMLKVMREKGLVKRSQGPRGYLWSATAGEKVTTKGLLRKLLDTAFEGSAQRLVAHLLEDGKLSRADRAQIQQMLDEHEPALTTNGEADQ